MGLKIYADDGPDTKSYTEIDDVYIHDLLAEDSNASICLTSSLTISERLGA